MTKPKMAQNRILYASECGLLYLWKILKTVHAQIGHYGVGTWVTHALFSNADNIF